MQEVFRGESLGPAYWKGQAEGSGVWQKSSCNTVSAKASVSPPGLPGPGVGAHQRRPTLGKGYQEFSSLN